MNIRETSLLYKMSEDELNSAVLWENCKNHNQTITFLKTDINSIIGFYCPDKFEETKFKKDSDGYPGWKDIDNGKPFIFYFQNDKFEKIEHKKEKISTMSSDRDHFLRIYGALTIDSNKKAGAYAYRDYFVYPENI